MLSVAGLLLATRSCARRRVKPGLPKRRSCDGTGDVKENSIWTTAFLSVFAYVTMQTAEVAGLVYTAPSRHLDLTELLEAIMYIKSHNHPPNSALSFAPKSEVRVRIPVDPSDGETWRRK